MNYTIRKAVLSDAAGTAKVHTETWKKHYHGQVPDEYLNNLSIERCTKTWTEIFSNPKTGTSNFVAEQEGKIIGFCSVGPSRDIDSPINTGELYSIYLEMTSHGKGIGTALMNIGLDFLREQGFKKVILWVLKTNLKTIRFYESKGWKFDGSEKIDKNDTRTFEELRYSLDL